MSVLGLGMLVLMVLHTLYLCLKPGAVAEPVRAPLIAASALQFSALLLAVVVGRGWWGTWLVCVACNQLLAVRWLMRPAEGMRQHTAAVYPFRERRHVSRT